MADSSGEEEIRAQEQIIEEEIVNEIMEKEIEIVKINNMGSDDIESDMANKATSLLAKMTNNSNEEIIDIESIDMKEAVEDKNVQSKEEDKNVQSKEEDKNVQSKEEDKYFRDSTLDNASTIYRYFAEGKGTLLPAKIMESDSDEEMPDEIDKIINTRNEVVNDENAQSEKESDKCFSENIQNYAIRNDDMLVYNPPTEDSKFVGVVLCCSLSNSGKLAATGTAQDRLYVWDTATGETIIDCSQENRFHIAIFSRNDDYLALGDVDTAKIWRIRDKRCIWSDHFDVPLLWMQWRNDILTIGNCAGNIHSMNMVPHEISKLYYSPYTDHIETQACIGIVFPNDKYAAIGYEDGAIQVVKFFTVSVISTMFSDQRGLDGHSKKICALDCYIDNDLLISTSEDGKTVLSSADNGKIISILQDLAPIVKPSPEEKDTIQEKDRPHFAGPIIKCAAFCKDPTFPVAATGIMYEENFTPGKIYIWDIYLKALKHEIVQESGVTALIWTNKLSILFTGGSDGIIRCIDAKTGNCLRSFSDHKHGIFKLCISSDNRKILGYDTSADARIFNISSAIVP